MPATPGFLIRPLTERPPTATLAPLREIQTSIFSDCLGRLPGAVGLRPFHRAGSPRMVGPAFTVKTRPGDNLMLHKALDLAAPGDIVVVDGGGDISRALLGELMLTYAISRQLGGLVIDGAIRDSAALAASEFPCFARGIIHLGPYKDGPGQINVPVNIGGMAVNPGDIVVGDEDGVVAFAPALLPALLPAAHAKVQQEEATRQGILTGKPNRDWVDKELRAKGVL